MKILTREEILAAKDLEVVAVDMPEWGGRVHVRMMTAGERDEYEQGLLDLSTVDKPDTRRRRVRARFLAWVIVDEAGRALFTESDIEALAAKGIRPIQRLFNVASELNALSDLDVKTLAKNSGAIPGESSPSSLPSGSDVPSPSSIEA